MDSRLSARAALVGVVLAGLAMAGCSRSDDGHPTAAEAPASASAGDQPSPTAKPAAPTGKGKPSASQRRIASPPPETNVAAACTSGGVSLRLVRGSSAAGQAYTSVVATNRGGKACTLRGYNAVKFLSGSKAPLAIQTAKLATPPASTVTLESGGSASAVIGTTAQSGGGAACTTTPAFVSITLPSGGAATRLAWTGGAVCPNARVVLQAYLPGVVTV